MTTDRGDIKFDVRGFEPAWCQLGFVNVTLPELGEDKEVSCFDSRVTATLLDAGQLWRLVMSLRMNREECNAASKIDCLAKRNEIFLAAHYAHVLRMACAYPAQSNESPIGR